MPTLSGELLSTDGVAAIGRGAVSADCFPNWRTNAVRLRVERGPALTGARLHPTTLLQCGLYPGDAVVVRKRQVRWRCCAQAPNHRVAPCVYRLHVSASAQHRCSCCLPHVANVLYIRACQARETRRVAVYANPPTSERDLPPDATEPELSSLDRADMYIPQHVAHQLGAADGDTVELAPLVSVPGA